MSILSYSSEYLQWSVDEVGFVIFYLAAVYVEWNFLYLLTSSWDGFAAVMWVLRYSIGSGGMLEWGWVKISHFQSISKRNISNFHVLGLSNSQRTLIKLPFTIWFMVSWSWYIVPWWLKQSKSFEHCWYICYKWYIYMHRNSAINELY